MNRNDYEIGKKGEDFFLNTSVHTLFSLDSIVRETSTGKCFSVSDLRSQKKEGEFALSDGSLVEVKSDHRCYETGNVIVELSGRNGDVGWFQHCKTNGVKYLVWNFYRGLSKKLPYLCVRFDFNTFYEYVNMLKESREYMRRNCIFKSDYDGAKFTLLKVHLEDAISHCHPDIAYTQVNEPEIVNELKKSLNAYFLRKGFQVDFDPCDCIIQYTPIEPDSVYIPF